MQRALGGIALACFSVILAGTTSLEADDVFIETIVVPSSVDTPVSQTIEETYLLEDLTLMNLEYTHEKAVSTNWTVPAVYIDEEELKKNAGKFRTREYFRQERIQANPSDLGL